MSDPIPQTVPFAYAPSVWFSDEQVIALARLLKSNYHGGLPFVRVEAALAPFDLALRLVTDDEARRELKREVRRQLEEAFVLELVNTEFQAHPKFMVVRDVLLCAQQRVAARMAALEVNLCQLRLENSKCKGQTDLLNTMLAASQPREQHQRY